MRRAAALLALGIAIGLVPTVAMAATPALAPTGLATLTITTPQTTKVGQVAVIVAHLSDGVRPIVGASLQFAVDGGFRRVATDAGGEADLPVRDLNAGRHFVSVSFDGRLDSTHAYVPAYANASFDMAPLRLLIRTVPTVAGVGFTVSGSTFTEAMTTGAGGTVAFDIPESGFANLSVQLPPSDDRSKVTFSRWSDDAFIPDRQIRLQDDVSLDCGLRISYPTSVEFFGLQGRTVDPGRVSDVELTGPNAEVIKLEQPYPPSWLSTPLPPRRSGQPGLHITPTPYAVTAGNYDGLSVINRGEQRFTPGPGATWRIELLLYDLRIKARDAVFGTSYPYHTVIVTDPLGRTRQLVLDGKSQASMTAGRGMYLVHVIAPGISPAAPVALSRSQTATMPIISPGDIVLFFGSGMLAMIVLFIVARRRRWLWRGITGSARRLRTGPFNRQGLSAIAGGGMGIPSVLAGDPVDREPPGNFAFDLQAAADLPSGSPAGGRMVGYGALLPTLLMPAGFERRGAAGQSWECYINDRDRAPSPAIQALEGSRGPDPFGHPMLVVPSFVDELSTCFGPPAQNRVANANYFMRSDTLAQPIRHQRTAQQSIVATIVRSPAWGYSASLLRGWRAVRLHPSVRPSLPAGYGVINFAKQRFAPAAVGAWRVHLLSLLFRSSTRTAVFGLYGHSVETEAQAGPRPSSRGVYLVPLIAPGILPAVQSLPWRDQPSAIPEMSRRDDRNWIWRRIEDSARRLHLKRA